MWSSRRSTGRHCSVFKCSNNNRKLFKWREEICTRENHLGLKHRDCQCVAPYSFCMFPKDPCVRQKWIKNINRKDFVPGRFAVVCTKHFVHGRPTAQNPCPTLDLGYELFKPGFNGRFRETRSWMLKKRLFTDNIEIDGHYAFQPWTSADQAGHESKNNCLGKPYTRTAERQL